MTEEENIEQFESDLRKGNYPESVLQDMKRKLEGELQEKKIEDSEETIKFYLDSGMNKLLEVTNGIYHFPLIQSEDGYFYLFAFNPSENGTYRNLRIEFADKNLKVLEVPEVIEPRKLGRIKLRFTGKRGFNTEMKVSVDVVYEVPKEITKFSGEEK